MSTFHTPQSIIDHGVRRDDDAEHQIRIVTPRDSMKLAVSCTCTNGKPLALIESDIEAWAVWRSFHELDMI